MDDIKRRLAEIDRQLDRGPAFYHQQIVTTAPLLFCALGLMAGIIIQNYLPILVWLWLILLVLSAVILVVSITRKFKQAYIGAYLALICFACLGAIRLTSFIEPGPNDIRNFVGSEPKLATIRGVIETKPYIGKRNWQFARFKYTDPATSFYLRVTKAKLKTGWTKTTGLVRVRVSEPLMDLEVGDRIQMYCRLDRF